MSYWNVVYGQIKKSMHISFVYHYQLGTWWNGEFSPDMPPYVKKVKMISCMCDGHICVNPCVIRNDL